MYETNVERESRIQKRDLNEVSNRKGLPILSVSKYLLPSRPAAFVLQKTKYVEEVVEAAPRLDSVDEVREKGKKGVEVKVTNERNWLRHTSTLEATDLAMANEATERTLEQMVKELLWNLGTTTQGGSSDQIG